MGRVKLGLTGGLGNDTLTGGTGNDTYVFNLGDGADTINNYDTAGTDTVVFGAGVVLGDLHDFIGLNNHLIFKVGSNGDQITINEEINPSPFRCNDQIAGVRARPVLPGNLADQRRDVSR